MASPTLIGGTPNDDILPGSNGNDAIYGQGGADTLLGNDGDDLLFSGDIFNPNGAALPDLIGDRLEGGSGNDQLTGAGGDDILVGGSGSNKLDGGAGVDTAFYTDVRGAYTLAQTATSIGVKATDGGSDTLTNIERIHFSDVSVAYDIDGTAGQVFRLYQAALDRAPDLGGLGYYFNAASKGVSMMAIATGFTHSPEFQKLYGADLSDQSYIENLYHNALHRDYDAGGMAYHLAALHNGLSREQLLINFSESPENKAAVIGAIEHGIEYIEVRPMI